MYALEHKDHKEEGGHLTDKNSPYVDKNEQCNVRKFLKREKVRVKVVRNALCETIHGVKGMACVRGGHNPFVMGFMQNLVHLGVVQTPVNPIDQEIGECDKQGELKEIVTSKRCIGRSVVKFGVAAYFAKEKGCREYRHNRKRD